MSSPDYIGLGLDWRAEDRKWLRFTIPGSTVICRTAGFWQRISSSGTEERSPVVDMSQGGISFLTSHPPKRPRVVLELKYADDREALSLKGKVIYSIQRGAGHSYSHRVAVEFEPFSDASGPNSPEARCVLEELEQRCAQADIQPSNAPTV